MILSQSRSFACNEVPKLELGNQKQKSLCVAPQLAGAAHRLEACATKGGGRVARPTWLFTIYGCAEGT
jgi:hypothetical protein